MSALMDDSQDERRMLADSVAGFAGEGRGIARARRLKAEAAGLDRAAWSEMADLGWLGILVPEAAGGLGLGVGELAVVAEGLGRDCAPEPLVDTVFAQAVLAGCDADHAGELLAATASGERLVAVAWQDEAQARGQEGPASVPADGGSGRLTGRRALVTPAEADVFVVAVGGPDGVALYAIERDAPGLSVETQPRVDGHAVLALTFDGVSLDDARRLAGVGAGDGALTRGLSVARVAASAELFGLAGALFEQTQDYLASRKQFGQALSSFQALRHRAVDLYIQRELMRNALRQAVRAFDSDADPVDLQRAAARAKARCSEAALIIGRQAVQLHGAIGYTEEANVGVYLRRVLSLAAWLGNADAQRREYARLTRAAA
ncbi:acyl-CoA dehydrogenase family protein [Salinisphaera orenii]|uniref:acyl-CoA dehydrogenase family protein n=1 Tax=Salinisphaera orenii TaxID=856731 RepID=UPI000F4C96AE|nr:acyl-CoA dehydrogenase family protein [Salinisphaera orenii]